jgi:hypothetical protein
MGIGASSIKYINFEEVIRATSATSVIINTLTVSEQNCLIVGTVSALEEEVVVNDLLKTNKQMQIIVYGKNCTDLGVVKKATQLQTIGFSNVCVYGGGMFEWLLLQDVYGKTEFKTTCNKVDLLKYK